MPTEAHVLRIESTQDQGDQKLGGFKLLTVPLHDNSFDINIFKFE